MATESPSAPAVKAPPVRRPSLLMAILLASSLVFFDAFFLNSGGISAIVAFGLLFVALPRTFAKKPPPFRAQRLRNIGIYGLAVVFVFVFNGMNNDLAQSGAETLISAVNAFHKKRQRYPRSLDELVPDFIAQVPPARKYTLGGDKFNYRPSEDGEDAMLSYVTTPPFGRRVYGFGSNRWVHID
jgi:hypothetical protein